MKNFSVHKVCIAVIGAFLVILGINTIHEIIDPTYHVASTRYVPRALFWYVVAYCWYKFLTIAYRIDLIDDKSIKTTSFTSRKLIDSRDIVSIHEHVMFIDVITNKGTVSVSTFMDGISDIKQILKSVATKSISDSSKEGAPDVEVSFVQKRNRKILKTFAVIVLIVLAVLVEWQQIILRTK